MPRPGSRLLSQQSRQAGACITLTVARRTIAVAWSRERSTVARVAVGVLALPLGLLLIALMAIFFALVLLAVGLALALAVAASFVMRRTQRSATRA
jgi:hypothetical protein